jgi:uncharacterized protein YbdZ (MbtH family)
MCYPHEPRFSFWPELAAVVAGVCFVIAVRLLGV